MFTLIFFMIMHATRAQLAPETLTAWVGEADTIPEDPPYVTAWAPRVDFPQPPCPTGTAKAGLKRTCFNEDAVTPADARLAKSARPENRIAIIRHYVQKYHLPGFTKTDVFTTDQLLRRGAPGRSGANEINAQVGMIRYQFFLEEEEAILAGRAQLRVGETEHMSEGFAAAARQSTVATAETFRRQRRLLDFWFPDAPAWTAILMSACGLDEDVQRLPFERCCFRKKDGCFALAADGPRKPASRMRAHRGR